MLASTFSEVFSGEKLKTVNIASTKINWGIVLTGKTLSQPLQTKDGYMVVSEGNFLTKFNQTGKLLWQRHFTKKIKPLISDGHGGMFYFVTGDKEISMLRDDGSTVWSSDAGFSITKNPFPGRDGRVYVFGESQVACFGTKGTRKWTAEIENINPNLEPVETDNGLLMIFLQTDSASNTEIKLVTPFGESAGSWILPGTVNDAETTEHGTLLALADGKLLLVKTVDGKPSAEWTIDSKTGEPVSIVSNKTMNSTYFLSSNMASKIQIHDGKIISSFPVFCDSQSIKYSDINIQGLVISDEENVTCYTDDGTVEWIAKLNPKKKWTHITATDDGHLVICTANWVIESYRVKQLPTAREQNSYSPVTTGTYEKLYDTEKLNSSSVHQTLIPAEQISSIKKSFADGDYGSNEKKWLNLITKEMGDLESAWAQTLFQTQTQKAYLATDLDYAFDILDLAAKTQTALYQKNIATLIHGTTDVRRMTKLITCAGEIAFDPDYLMLTEMEKIVQKYPKADTILALICDSTVAICNFMGKEAFTKKGGKILTTMLGNQYSNESRINARNALAVLNKTLGNR